MESNISQETRYEAEPSQVRSRLIEFIIDTAIRMDIIKEDEKAQAIDELDTAFRIFFLFGKLPTESKYIEKIASEADFGIGWILFLDIDGVFNRTYTQAIGLRMEAIDLSALHMFCELFKNASVIFLTSRPLELAYYPWIQILRNIIGGGNVKVSGFTEQFEQIFKREELPQFKPLRAIIAGTMKCLRDVLLIGLPLRKISFPDIKTQFHNKHLEGFIKKIITEVNRRMTAAGKQEYPTLVMVIDDGDMKPYFSACQRYWYIEIKYPEFRPNLRMFIEVELYTGLINYLLALLSNRLKKDERTLMNIQ